MNMRKFITAILISAVLFGCSTTEITQVEEQKTTRVNIVNRTSYQIFEVYFQKDIMPDRGRNLVTMIIESGKSRTFIVDPGKYKLIVVFVVNDNKIPVQYNDLLLPGYEYAWEITEENVDLPESGAYEGFISDLGTEASVDESEEITVPEDTEEE